MALSVTEIGAVVEEIAPALVGGWIQKVYQPLPLVLIFEIRVPGQTHRLLISANPDTARLHLVHTPLPNPSSPPSFCQLLRARLQGAHVNGLAQVNHDRIVRIEFIAQEKPCILMLELVGRKADVLFVDHQDIVVATIANNRDRIGQPYQMPHAPPRSKVAVSGLRERDGLPPAPQGLSATLEVRYRTLEQQSACDQLRQRRLTSLRKTLKKTQRRIDALAMDLEKAAKYRDHARYGELIKANLSAIVKGQPAITVVDYYDDHLPQLTIPLDPTKTPQGNMDDYFAKYRKHVSAEREIHPRLEATEQEADTLRREIAAVQDPAWQPSPSVDSSQQRSADKPVAKTTDTDRRQGPFRRFTSTDGLPIYVGRNARENDDLTFSLAKSDDLWLHAQGVPGSHVVVRLEKGADVPPETLRDAATLALLFSDLKKSGKGDVIYTKRKWVRKAKGRTPGAVTVTQEKSIHMNLDKTRLEALKHRTG